MQKAKRCFPLSLFPAGLCDHADRVDEWHDVGVDVPVVEREVVPAEEVDRRQAVDQHAARETKYWYQCSNSIYIAPDSTFKFPYFTHLCRNSSLFIGS